MCCNIYTKKESRLGLSCDPDATRTHDRLLRRQMLYPAELPDLYGTGAHEESRFAMSVD